MERKEAANGLQLIKIAGIKMKGNFSALFMGTLAMTTPLILVLFMSALMAILFASPWVISIGVVLFAILVGPLQVGHIKYFNAVLDGKQPKIGLVYSQLRFNVFTLRTILIAGLLLLMYLIGGALWIVPAGFAVSFFSMIMFFLEKFQYEKFREAMKDCATKMMGNRLAMFSYKLIFYFIYMMLFIVGLLMLALVYTLSMENLVISWIISMCSVVVFIFLYTLVTVYFHSSNQIFFEDVLTRAEKKKSKVKSSVNSTEALSETKDSKVESEPKTKEVKKEKETKEDTKKSKTTKAKKETTNKKETVKSSEKLEKEDKGKETETNNGELEEK